MTHEVRSACIAALEAKNERTLRLVLKTWADCLAKTQDNYESLLDQYISPWSRLFAGRVAELTHGADLCYIECREEAKGDPEWLALQQAQAKDFLTVSKTGTVM